MKKFFEEPKILIYEAAFEVVANDDDDNDTGGISIPWD